MFTLLTNINYRPRPFEFYTNETLWNDEHISKQMLKYHLMENVDVSSRNHAFINRSAHWMAEHFSIDRSTKICDLGCGPGLYAARLAQFGAQVTGIDFSLRSIAYARETAYRNGLTIDYRLQNYLSVRFDEKMDLITLIMCDFCALSPVQRRRLLENCIQMLTDRGSILLDVYSLNAFDKRKECAVYEFNQMDGFWSINDYYAFLSTFKYEEEKVVLDKYTIIESDRTWQVYNWLQYFNLCELEREFQDCGLQIKEVYSDVAGSSYREEDDEYAVVASRSV